MAVFEETSAFRSPLFGDPLDEAFYSGAPASGVSLPSSTIAELLPSTYGGTGTSFAANIGSTDWDAVLDAATPLPPYSSGPPAYFNGNGVNAMALASNPAFVNGMHGSSAEWWIAIPIKTAGTIATTGFCGTGAQLTDAGFRIIMTGTSLFLQVYNTSGSLALSQSITHGLSTNTDHLIILNFKNGNTLDAYIDGSKTSFGANTITSPSGASATNTMTIMEQPSGFTFATDVRFYGMAVGDTLLTDDDAAQIRTYYQSIIATL